MAAGGGGAVSNARRRRRRGGSENLLGTRINGAGATTPPQQLDFDFGANNNQPLCIESGQAASCGKSSKRQKGEGRCQRGDDKQRGGGLRQQRGRGLHRCRRCRHCCCYPCRHRMPPRQLCHYCLCSSSGSSGGSSSGLRRCAVAASADSRMPSLTLFCVCLLSECSLHVAQNTMSRVLPYGIPEQINLALE